MNQWRKKEMNRNEIENKINLITQYSQYIRVSDSHPLELYIGKNEKGYPTLRYNGDFQPVKIVGNSILEIKQVKTANYISILFSYTAKENFSLFYNFCEDIINQTSDYSGNDGYIEIVNRYNQWKKMFYGNSKILSENEVIGLIGELLFLKDYCFPIYGISIGLNGWSGPEPTHKDFSYKNEWYEIKSINSFKNTVSISSIEQLDSLVEGKLVVYSFEKMSPSFNGISLNALVVMVSNMIQYETDKDIFFEKLKQVGYSYNEVYDNYVYNMVNVDKYVVNAEFPKIKAEDLPNGIGKVQYEILLSLIEKFKED